MFQAVAWGAEKVLTARRFVVKSRAMHFWSLLVLSVGLAMDSAAASATRGLLAKRLLTRHFVSVALFFGGFQALMPWLGWLIGQRIGPLLSAWDHWIAFTLLAAIGGKMIYEATRAAGDEPTPQHDGDPFGTQVMTGLAIATSIDAFAVGVTLPMLGAPFALSLATIGITTALLSMLALALGRRFGEHLGARLDVFGGLCLVLLGVKILVEHLQAG